MTLAIPEALINELVTHAQTNTAFDRIYDDEEKGVLDVVGTNIDDVFESGIESGYAMLAREILSALKIDYTA